MSLATTGALSANQSIPNTTWTTIIFNSASGDRRGAPSLNTTTGVYTVQLTGFYRIGASVTWEASDGPHVIRLLRNGNVSVPIFNSTLNVTMGTGNIESQCFEYAAPLLSGDTITFQAWQNSGGALNIIAALDPSGGTQPGTATLSFVNLVQLPPI